MVVFCPREAAWGSVLAVVPPEPIGLEALKVTVRYVQVGFRFVAFAEVASGIESLKSNVPYNA
jgi:hypothetical protein